MEDFIIGALKSSPLIKRYYANPILSARDIPYQSLLIYNPGVVKLHGKYVMVFNNDYGSLEDKRIDGTNIGLAFSDDGIKWQVQPEPCFELANQEILRVYDPQTFNFWRLFL